MATVPAVADLGGGVLTTTTANALIRDPLKFLMRPPGAQVRQTTLQSIANNSTTAAVTFGAEDWDDDPFGVAGVGTHHDNATNNTRITIAYAGKYRLSAGITFATNVTGRRGLLWAVNGSLVTGGESAFASAVNGQNCAVTARTIEVILAVGDYVEVMAFQDSGGALNTAVSAAEQATMTARWVSLS